MEKIGMSEIGIEEPQQTSWRADRGAGDQAKFAELMVNAALSRANPGGLP